VYVLFLHKNGTVKTEQKISDTQGNFQGVLNNSGEFGRSVTGLGDIDGDATQDLAVGAPRDDDGGTDRGAVYLLFLYTNGTVKAEQKISDTEGNFQGVLDEDHFGISVAALGDFDGDATNDLAVGAHYDDDGGTDRGAVYVLFLHPNGTVKAEQKISDTDGNFQGVLANGDYFGSSVAALGDLDGDVTQDLAVGAFLDDDGGTDRGALYVLFLTTPVVEVRSEQKISDTEGNFQGVLNNSDFFGASVATLGDLDGDGTTDLAVGAYTDGDGGTHHGAVYVLFLHKNGTVKEEQKVSDTEGNFQGVLKDGDKFGNSVTATTH
jgi:FG-GAP repeat